MVYMADSETEMVEWMSALEGAVSRLMRIIAGVADEEQPQAPSHNSSSAANHNSMLAQAENAFKQRAQQQSWSEPPQQRVNYGVQGAHAATPISIHGNRTAHSVCYIWYAAYSCQSRLLRTPQAEEQASNSQQVTAVLGQYTYHF